MFDYSQAEIAEYTLHYIGNKLLEKPLLISTSLNDHSLASTTIKLFNHLLKPMQKSKEGFKLKQEGYLFKKLQQFEEQQLNFVNLSASIAEHLYNQSQHHHIKNGECFIVHFQDLVLDGELCNAIGIFKVERKDEFLHFTHSQSAVEAQFLKGVQFQKIDKGCIVFLTEKESGFRVINVDSNNYDTQYWQTDFLDLVPDINESTHTKNMVHMVQDFTKEVLAPKFDKKQQTDFIAEAVKFMESKPAFQFEQFVEDVVKEPELKAEFNDFRADFSKRNFIPLPNEFEINEQTFEKQKKQLKSLIKLDTHIQIKIDFDHENTSKYLVKGFDEEKGMHFYTIYFNEEMN